VTRAQFAILLAVVIASAVTILLVCSNRAVVKPIARIEHPNGSRS
jgi:hypothetical protein